MTVWSVEVGRAAIGPNASAGRVRSSRPTFVGIVLVSRAIVVRAWREQDDHEHECEEREGEEGGGRLHALALRLAAATSGYKFSKGGW